MNSTHSYLSADVLRKRRDGRRLCRGRLLLWVLKKIVTYKLILVVVRLLYAVLTFKIISAI